jgi:NAD-dependent DNA ligase
MFGFGLGEKKLQKLLADIPDIMERYQLEVPSTMIKRIKSVEGFSDKTAAKVMEGLPKFHEFFSEMRPYVYIAGGGSSSVNPQFQGMKIVLTGFRDKELEEFIVAAGGQVVGSVSKHTSLIVAANPSESSSKLEKARELGIRVLSKDEFNATYKE